MRQATFTDFDEFAASVRDVDCRMMVQSPVVHQWSLNIANAGEAEVQFGSLGTGNILEGKSWKDGVLVYLPLTPETRFSANGQTIRPGSIMVLEPNSHFDLSSNGQHDWCTIFIPRMKFGEKAWNKPRSFITRAEPVIANRMKSLVGLVLAASKKSETFANCLAGRRVEGELVDLIARILALPVMEENTLLNRKHDYRDRIRNACNYFEELPYDEIRVSEIAKMLDISERTLRYHFHQYFSASPKRYLETLAIRLIRDKLIKADPEEQTVTSILFDHGVCELGRFAGRYKQLYGELPSETLKAPR